MISATPAVARPHGTLGTVMMSLFFRCVSKHAKRLFYISSLCGHFDHYSHRHNLTVSKLNEVMRLGLREDAMTVPAGVRAHVWQDTGLEQILTEERLVNATSLDSLRALARQVVAVSRRWWYADPEEMTEDVTAALKAQRRYLMEGAFA